MPNYGSVIINSVWLEIGIVRNNLNVHVALVWARGDNEAKVRSTNQSGMRNNDRTEGDIAYTPGELNRTAFQMKTKILRVS